MDNSQPQTDVDRRTVLRGVGTLAAGAALAGAAAAPTRAQESPGLAAWFEDVDNFDGLVDARGESEVSVAVGSPGNGGAFGFGPAAVRVDPGTTVVWEWTGEGGMHNVAATDGAYESELLTAGGETFEHTFADAGVSTYVCTPHEAMGMKAAVVVGDVPVDIGLGGLVEVEPDYGDWFDGVENYAGTVDMRGQDEVTIAVGAAGNGGNHAFEPAAVRVDQGTTVVWEWTGEGGAHDVQDSDGVFASEPTDVAGATYSLAFDGDGISTYACTSGASDAMRGAVVVGEPEAGVVHVSETSLLVGGLLGTALAFPLALMAFLLATGEGDEGGVVHAPGGNVPAERRDRRR
ncbi:halocyanin domain-containing protein [Haloarchaeobius baliensis]|uniref:halocyanin domain-containing protein n=1 Tax=Haloarchaeobius baliensis TaxID=1670458 RepID=UPI003F88134C